MKKFLSLLLSLCLLLGTLPLQVSAFAGDIFPSESTVKTVTLNDGSLSLQNEYIHMTFRKLWGSYAYLTVAPAAKPDEESILIGQTPRCSFITYDQGREKIEGVVTEPIKAEFVTKTPNGSANAIKVEYSLLAALSLIKAKATVYYELVQLKENGAWINEHKRMFKNPDGAETLIIRELFKDPKMRESIHTKNILSNRPSADIYIAAKAKQLGATVVTAEEYKPHSAQLPNICEKLSVTYITFDDFMERVTQ